MKGDMLRVSHWLPPPQVLRAQPVIRQEEQRDAGHGSPVIQEAHVADAEPVGHCIEHQAQANAGRHALQHLHMGLAFGVHAGLDQVDGQDHGTGGLHPQQQFIGLPGSQVQLQGVRTSRQGPLVVGHVVAQGVRLGHMALVEHGHLDLVQ
jgi:hypothetical protein